MVVVGVRWRDSISSNRRRGRGQVVGGRWERAVSKRSIPIGGGGEGERRREEKEEWMLQLPLPNSATTMTKGGHDII